MLIKQNIELKSFTSMHVGGPARFFVEVATVGELVEALRYALEKKLPYFILGGGSNILVSDHGFDGLVIRICIMGKKLLIETKNYIEYEIGAGENWDEFVQFAISQNLFGIENMSHIPGSVGASVVQNVGSYGQEVAETAILVNLIDTKILTKKSFKKEEMWFSYRRSRLNDVSLDKEKYVVTSVVFKLQKGGKLNMKYGDIQKYFIDHREIAPSLKTIRQAVIQIRASKFPYPDSLENGTAGSFWNTDVVNARIYDRIIAKLKEKGLKQKVEYLNKMRDSFTVAQGLKIPYGILIESLNFKGKVHGGAKILETHAGVINNFTGEATAQDVYGLSQDVINTVYSEFGVRLKIEPELVGKF